MALFHYIIPTVTCQEAKEKAALGTGLLFKNQHETVEVPAISLATYTPLAEA